MNAISIEQLATRTHTDLSILLGLCHAAMQKYPPMSPKWRAAQATAENILRLRPQRGPRDLGYQHAWSGPALASP